MEKRLRWPAYPELRAATGYRAHGKRAVGWPCLKIGRCRWSEVHTACHLCVPRVKGPKSPMAADTFGSSPDDRFLSLPSGVRHPPNPQHAAKLLTAPRLTAILSLHTNVSRSGTSCVLGAVVRSRPRVGTAKVRHLDSGIAYVCCVL